MSLHFYHTLTGLAILFFIICKLALHYYLDKRHQRSLGWKSLLISPGYYLRRYQLPVDEKAEKWKYLCNACLVLAIVALVLNFLIGKAIYTKKGI